MPLNLRPSAISASRLAVPLGDRLPLVVGLLASRQGDLHLGAAVLEVQRQRDEREPLLAHLRLDLVDLGAVQQQLAPAADLVVGPGPLGVRRDVHLVQEHLTVLDLGEAVDERRPAGAQRLDLGALEDDAGLVGVLDVVVVARLLVLRDELAPRLLGHAAILSGGAKTHPPRRRPRTHRRGYRRWTTGAPVAKRPSPCHDRRLRPTPTHHHEAVDA